MVISDFFFLIFILGRLNFDFVESPEQPVPSQLGIQKSRIDGHRILFPPEELEIRSVPRHVFQPLLLRQQILLQILRVVFLRLIQLYFQKFNFNNSHQLKLEI